MVDFERSYTLNRTWGVNTNEEDGGRDISEISGTSCNVGYQQFARLFKTDARQYVLNMLRTKSLLSDRPMLVIEGCNWRTAERKSCQFIEDLLEGEKNGLGVKAQKKSLKRR